MIQYSQFPHHVETVKQDSIHDSISFFYLQVFPNCSSMLDASFKKEEKKAIMDEATYVFAN